MHALKTRDQLQRSTIADVRERADALVASARSGSSPGISAREEPAATDTAACVDAVAFARRERRRDRGGDQGTPRHAGQAVKSPTCRSVGEAAYAARLAAVAWDAAAVTRTRTPEHSRTDHVHVSFQTKGLLNKVRGLTNRLGASSPECCERGRDIRSRSGCSCRRMQSRPGTGRCSSRRARPVSASARQDRPTTQRDSVSAGRLKKESASSARDLLSHLKVSCASLSGYETSSPLKERRRRVGDRIIFRGSRPARGDDQFEAIAIMLTEKPSRTRTSMSRFCAGCLHEHAGDAGRRR